MKKQLTLLTFFVFLSFAFAGNDDPTFTESSAQPDGNSRVRISWVTKDESQLKHFVVQRSNDDKNFIDLDRISLKGPGFRYEYFDDDVLFKSGSALYYKVVAYKKDGSKVETSSMLVHPNISGIFKTWGAIKAMFR